MYTHVFCFTFAETVPPAERMRFLAALFDLPEQVGCSPKNIYWFKMSIKGAVEFYSSHPDVTTAVEQKLCESEAKGVLTQDGGFATIPTFFWRLVAGLSGAAIRALIPKRR